MSTLPVVLSFGLSDATGATGLQADSLAVASMGCHPTSVITAVATAGGARNDDWVAIDEDLLVGQGQAVLQNMPVAAFKVGAIGAMDQLQPIAAILADFDSVPVVLDPVIGRDLDEDDDADFAAGLRELLIPQTTVLTLGLAQARRLVSLADEQERGEELTAEGCARELIGWGCEFVLFADAEPGSEQIVNALYDETGLVRSDRLPRLDAATTRVHGAGDTLSAALAGLLAQGLDVPEAMQEASQYTAAAVLHSFHAGIGMAIPDRLFWAGDDDDEDTGTDEH
jgi:hydroxymethylpyrimidine/phosphomethylpyrimidine kinase